MHVRVDELAEQFIKFRAHLEPRNFRGKHRKKRIHSHLCRPNFCFCSFFLPSKNCDERGVILDDEVNATIVRPLGPGVKLHAIIDTCHHPRPLPYLCRISRTGYWQWENHSRPSGEPKGINGGLAISISGCGDSQTSQDTTVRSAVMTCMDPI
jgi:hypothetical protein